MRPIDPANAHDVGISPWLKDILDTLGAIRILPDLTVTFAKAWTSPTPHVEALVKNIGLADAGPFRVLAVSRAMVLSANVPGLVRGDSTLLTFRMPVCPTTPGEGAAAAILLNPFDGDGSTTIEELDHNNNVAYVAVPESC